MRRSRLYLGLFATLGFALLLAQSLNNLAPLYTETDDYATAEPLYERALAIREKELGPEHPDIGTSLKDLALLYQAKGEYAKAEPLLQRALAISEKYLGPEHPNTAICLKNLAALYEAMGDYAKAEPLLRRDLSIREKALGPEHPDTAQSIDNLATLYMAMGNYAKAEPLLRRGLWIRDKAREHPDIGRGIDDILTSGAILTPKAERAPPTASIPKFPWPPPRASTEHQIHHKWVAEGDHTTLVDVAERLETVLGIAGFETWKYSSVPNGFALVTQIEQILPDGTPRPERFRTDLPSLSDLSFVEFLIALAKAPSGYYRVIVFVVTDTPFSQRETPPTESEARRWLDAGLNKLPASFSEVIYGEDYRTTALIYQFKKLSNQPATLVLPSLASARAHLERAQIWPVLTR